MATYNWTTHAWHAQAEAAERSERPFLSQRRWTEKDAIVQMASPPLMFGWGATVGWPEIPKGVGADFEGERALRVFLEITDGRAQRPLAPGAILFARLSGADAARAGLTKDDEFLVVPVKFFIWVAGALSFDKKVLLSLSQPIMERSLSHKDAEIWPELTWITPMKKDDRRYYYSVLPLVGMGGVIDPVRGNPSLYAPIQTDPYRNIVWDIVDEVIDGGTSVWGTGATSGDGAASIFATKLRLVNFLRDLADKFAVEELLRKRRRGVDLGLSDILKAFGDGLFHHRPEAVRVKRENALLEWWFWKVYVPRLWRLATHGVRGIGYSEVAKQTADGLGEWEGSAHADLMTARIFAAAYLCERFGEMSVAAREDGTNATDADRQKHAVESYIKGSVTPQEAWEIGQHKVTLPGMTAGVPTEDDLYQKWLRNFEPKLKAILGPGFHI